MSVGLGECAHTNARTSGTVMSGAGVRANFIFNLIGPLVRLVVALVTIPIYIRHVGEARYGVISIAWVLLGYFGFLDLGLTRAAINALAKLRDAPQPERARVLLTTMTLNVGFGAAGGVILFFLGGHLLEYVVSIPESLKPEVARSFPWLATLFPFALIEGVGVGALESRERFLLANVLQVLGTSLTQIAPVVMAVLVSPSLTVVVPAAAIANALSVVLVLAVVYRLEGPFSVRGFDWTAARSLLSYGGWISVSNVLSPIFVSADQFVIGSIKGIAAVPHYSVPMSMVVRSQLFPAAVARTFFPLMSSLPPRTALEFGARGLSAVSYGYAVICGPAIIMTPAFFRYWIGPDFAQAAAPVGQILFIGAWINGVAFVAFTLLQGQGRPDLTGKLHTAEVLPYLIVLWGLTTTLGIAGAAIAWTLRCTVDAFAMSLASGMPKRDLVSALRPVAVLAACGVASRIVGADVVFAFPAALVAGLAAVALAYTFSEDWRRLLQTLLAQVLRRGTVIISDLRRIASLVR